MHGKRFKSSGMDFFLHLVLYAAMNVLQSLRGGEAFDFYSLLMWVVIYSIFAILGVGISGLFHYARQTKKLYRFLANSMGILLIVGLCLFANALVGNPISKAIATKQAKAYLEKNYAEKGFELKKFLTILKTEIILHIWNVQTVWI